MDTKRLRQAIKELRAELDRVNLAIRRIEIIAADVDREQQIGKQVSEPKPRSDESGRSKD